MSSSGECTIAAAKPGALEHALRERADAPIDRVGDPDALDDTLHLAREVLAAHPVQPAAERHELARRQVRVDVRVLGEEADVAHRLGGGDLLPEDRGLAARGEDEPREHLDRRRLAGAVGAEEAEDVAAAHLERDAAHGLDLLARERFHEGLGELLDGEDDLGPFHEQPIYQVACGEHTTLAQVYGERVLARGTARGRAASGRAPRPRASPVFA